MHQITNKINHLACQVYAFVILMQRLHNYNTENSVLLRLQSRPDAPILIFFSGFF